MIWLKKKAGNNVEEEGEGDECQWTFKIYL